MKGNLLPGEDRPEPGLGPRWESGRFCSDTSLAAHDHGAVHERGGASCTVMPQVHRGAGIPGLSAAASARS